MQKRKTFSQYNLKYRNVELFVRITIFLIAVIIIVPIVIRLEYLFFSGNLIMNGTKFLFNKNVPKLYLLFVMNI